MVHSRSRVRSGAVWLVLGSAACAAGLGVAACSSPFSGCESTRDCASSAAGSSAQAGERDDAPSGEAGARSNGAAGADPGQPNGAAGESTGGTSGNTGASGGADNAGAPSSEAGAGGEAPTPECVTDADCSDHLACNGTELCQAGVCKPGVAPCANPEPAHCDVLCAEVAGAASCTVRGQDKDKDGHFSSACVTKPGDDCNDAVASTHPGAPELCDGVDNDCDGKIDVNDGLSVSGSNVAIGSIGARSLPTIAWATDKSVYGIAYRNTGLGAADLFFEEVDKTGTLTRTPAAFNDASTMLGAAGTGLALTWGGDTFGALWVTDTGLALRSIGSNGSLDSILGIPVPSGVLYRVNPVVARNTTGTWAALYATQSGSVLDGNTVSPIGVVGPTVTFTSQPASVSMVASGANFVIGAVGTTQPSTLFDDIGLWSSNLDTPRTLTTGQDSVIGSGPNGIAVTSFPKGTQLEQFSAFSASGTKLCGPVNLPTGFRAASIVATPTGYLLASSDAVRVQEVLANCTLGQLFTLQPAAGNTNVSIAGSAAGYGVVWQDATTGVPTRRMFGAHYCD